MCICLALTFWFRVRFSTVSRFFKNDVMPLILRLFFNLLFVSSAVFVLASCGNGEDTSGPLSASGDCPPAARKGGLSVSSRVNIEEAMKYTQWLLVYPPQSCAGSLAGMIADLPDGYGLAPSSLTRPPVMGEDHVAFSLGEVPDALTTQNGTANVPLDMKRIDYEILRFSPEERATLDAWLAGNKASFITKTFEGQQIYLAGALATMRPGKPGRIGAGITVLLRNNLLLRMSYTDMIAELGGKDNPVPDTQGNIALEFLADLISRAKAEGLL